LLIHPQVLSYLVENAIKRSHLQGLMFGIGRVAVSYRDELVLDQVESDDPGAAGFVEMAADSIADALLEFGEGFGLGEDGLTEGPGLVAPFGRFLNQKDDFIHRLSYYIE